MIRAARVWANDLDNIPAFFALCGLAIALDAPTMLSAWLSIVFTLARVLHTLAYLAGVQPWRTVCYGIGVLVLVGFCTIVTVRVVNSFVSWNSLAADL
ncbi:MAPEG family protein [compost metagenome]